MSQELKKTKIKYNYSSKLFVTPIFTKLTETNI